MATTVSPAGLLALLLLASHPAMAHHSTALEYDYDLAHEFDAVLAGYDWVNPHVWFYFDETMPDGTVKRWSIQSRSPAQLRRMMESESGIGAFDLGETYTVRVVLHRWDPANGLLRSMQFPSGALFSP